MKPTDLAARLSERALDFCSYLLPAGRKAGHEWVVGDTDGSAGESLKVCISGTKAGVGADFATGQKFGDLLDLCQAVRNCTLREAMQEAANFLGIVPDGRDTAPKKSYRRPARPKSVSAPKPQSAAMQYLLQRGFLPETLAAFQIAFQPVAARFGPQLKQGTLRDASGEALLFPYKRDGELVNIKYLALERTPAGKKISSQETGAEPCLFGWQALDPSVRQVCLTEGEFDAMSLHQCGIPALSVPNGGGGGHKQDWIENDYDRLDQFDVIFLCLDADEAGQVATKEIARRLGEERCRVVTLPHKDANECLQKGLGRAEFLQALAHARALDPDELKPPSSFLDGVLHEFFPAAEDVMASTPWGKVGSRIVFRPGDVSLWTGINGHGKSLVLGYVILFLASKGIESCIASMEMPPRKTLVRMLRQAGALAKPSEGYIRHMMDWLEGRIWLFDVQGTAKADRMLEVFAYATRRYNIRVFIIDSLLKCGFDEEDYDGQKKFMDRLTDFAIKYHAHVHLVAHARKGRDEYAPPRKMDVRGTGALTDLAANVLIVWRNKAKEEKMARADREGVPADEATINDRDCVLIVDKQRDVNGWEGEVALWFDPESLQFLEHAHASPCRYVAYSSAGESIEPASNVIQLRG